MSLADTKNKLSACRDRFVQVLTAQMIPVRAGATLHQCIDALAAYWADADPGGDETGDVTTWLTLIAPSDPALYAGLSEGASTAGHAWSDDDVLSVKIWNGSTLVTSSCTGYNGADFEANSLSHLCAGNRVACNVGTFSGSVNLTIDWQRKGNTVKTETRTFAGTHVPQYFTRPSGNGNYILKLNGSTAAAEVYYHSQWMDFPSGGLPATYAGCPVRLKTDPRPSLNALACWSSDGADGDPFWYFT